MKERNKGVIFKNCAPFVKRISKIYNTEIDNTKYIDIVMPMYNLIELVIIIPRHLGVYGNTIMFQIMI